MKIQIEKITINLHENFGKTISEIVATVRREIGKSKNGFYDVWDIDTDTWHRVSISEGNLVLIAYEPRRAAPRSAAAIARDLPAGYSASGTYGRHETCSCGKNNCDGNSPFCG